MPSELVTRVNLDLLYPPLAEKVIHLAANCRARGYDYYITTGFRSAAEQMRLWTQGRTRPGKKVTSLKFGMHQLGLAVDWTHDADLGKPGLQPDWAETSYAVLAEEAEKLGLVAGAYWKTFRDLPHVEWPIAPRSISGLKRIHDQSGVKGVWDFLDGK